MEKLSKLDNRIFGIPTNLDSILQRYRIAVERAIGETDLIQESPLSREAMAVMQSGGKRLRPSLVLLTCEAVSGQYTTALPTAIAYELAHQASLVQDDVFDDSDLRHEKITVHKRQGIVGAILVSDLMIFEILNQLAKYETTSLTKPKMARLLNYIARAANLTIKGEYLDAKLAGASSSMSEAQYLEVASLKTGALLAATTASGALVGGGSEKVVDSMYRFGENLGVAFQIKDDILDVSGDASKLGKPVMKDLQNNAFNIVLIKAMETGDVFQRNAIHSMLYKKWFASGDLEQIHDVLKELKSIEHASKLAEKYTRSARECLKVIRESPAKDRLLGLTYALEMRQV